MSEDKYVSKQETNGQRLTVSFVDKAQFVDQGLRGFFQYWDLGLKASTGGRFNGQVIRAKRGLNESTGVHSHLLEFQLIYILKGAVTVRSELDGVFRLKAGDSVLQPPGGKQRTGMSRITCSRPSVVSDAGRLRPFPS